MDSVFADAPWWVKALGAYAAVYVAELVKEAGKETWKQRVKLVHRAAAAGCGIIKLAASLAALRSRLPERSKLVLGLPVPDNYIGVRFELIGRDEDPFYLVIVGGGGSVNLVSLRLTNIRH